MDLYNRLKNNPPTLKVEGKPTEMKIDVVSVMCDNKYRWSVKQIDGNYHISTSPFSYTNFDLPYYKDDVEWEMDNGNWNKVFRMINEGTTKIEKIKYR